MEIFIQKQLINIVYSLIIGLIFGGLYDIIRIVHIFCGIASYSGERHKMKEGAVPFVLFFLLDAVYMLTVTVLFSIFIYAFESGNYRWYLLAGVIFGMLLYFLTVGRLMMFFAESIVRFLRMIFRLIIAKPLCFIGRYVRMVLVWIGLHTVGRIVCGILRISGYIYTEKMRRRIERDIRFTKDNGKGRDF